VIILYVGKVADLLDHLVKWNGQEDLNIPFKEWLRKRNESFYH
jgi:hypothetical protein